MRPETSSADGVLRTGNGQLMLATLRGRHSTSALEQMRVAAPLVQHGEDPMVRLIGSQLLCRNARSVGTVPRGAPSVARQELELAKKYRLALRDPTRLLIAPRPSGVFGSSSDVIATLNDVRIDMQRRRLRSDERGSRPGTRVSQHLGQPERALEALEDITALRRTPGMEAEYDAWWALVLASRWDDHEAAAANRREAACD